MESKSQKAVPGKSGKAKYGIQSIGVTLRILEALASSASQKGISEIARELGTNKWKVFRYLHSLQEEGYVTQDPDSEKFELGERFYILTASTQQNNNVIEVSRPLMKALNRELGHTVALSTLLEETMVILDVEIGRTPVHIIAGRGSKIELHCTAQGKVALAFGAGSLLEKILSNPLPPVTANTITDPTLLLQEIAQVRRQGWAVAPNEYHLGINALSAPIMSVTKKFTGCLTMINTIQALPSQPPAATIERLVESAAFISKLVR